MFPDPCGDWFEQQVRSGADPKSVVPDDYFLAYGGQDPPPAGRTFSAGVGPTLEAAAAAVPHGQVRVTRVRQVRSIGATVEWVPELSRHGTINHQHVNVSAEGAAVLPEQGPNPVSRVARIDGCRK